MQKLSVAAVQLLLTPHGQAASCVSPVLSWASERALTYGLGSAAELLCQLWAASCMLASGSGRAFLAACCCIVAEMPSLCTKQSDQWREHFGICLCIQQRECRQNPPMPSGSIGSQWVPLYDMCMQLTYVNVRLGFAGCVLSVLLMCARGRKY